MAKKRSVYVCQECGYKAPAWAGRCPNCGGWGTLVEDTETKLKGKSWISSLKEPVQIGQVRKSTSERLKSGIAEFDRLAGGGVVKGSVSLLSGEPGIGKSTFLLQLSNRLAKYGSILYVSAEESPEQISLRASRLGIEKAGIFLLANNNLEEVLKVVEKEKPVFVVFDSIQTLYLPYIDSAAGSVSQVREGAAFITAISKSKGITSFIVGHVTKEGAIAGPKVLEHVVDAVYQFEGDRGHNFRVMKSLKNRFGSTGEIAVFQMREKGLIEVPNPSKFFLSERPKGKPGSVIFAGIEGTRPVLLEVQALVTRASFSTPQRRSKGISSNRLSIIIATIEKELGFPLRNFDIFVNVVGGINVDEPAVDLAVAMAIVSSYKGKPVKEDCVIFGEVGLVGEIRSVRLDELRVKEARRNGFFRVIAPSEEEGVLKVNSLEDAVKIVFS